MNITYITEFYKLTVWPINVRGVVWMQCWFATILCLQELTWSQCPLRRETIQTSTTLSLVGVYFMLLKHLFFNFPLNNCAFSSYSNHLTVYLYFFNFYNNNNNGVCLSYSWFNTYQVNVNYTIYKFLKACLVVNVSGGNTGGAFAVAPTSGNITVKQPTADPTTYNLVVQAKASETPPDTANANVTVTIQADCHAQPNSASFFPVSVAVLISALLAQTLQ